MYCKHCGNALEPSARFCHFCGKPLAASLRAVALDAAPADPSPSAPPIPRVDAAQCAPAADAAKRTTAKPPLLLFGALALTAGLLAGIGLRHIVQAVSDAAADRVQAASANAESVPARDFSVEAAPSETGGLLCSGVSAGGCDRMDIHLLLVSESGDVTLRSVRPVQTLYDLPAAQAVGFSLAPPVSGDVFEVLDGVYTAQNGGSFAAGSLLPFSALAAQGLAAYQTMYAFFQGDLRLAVLNADGSRSD